MSKSLLGVLLFVSCSMLFQHCDNIAEPNDLSRSDIIGDWHEIDTLTGAENWLFSDTTVIHGFKNLDTIGRYSAWKISNDTIILTNEQNNSEYLIFSKLNNSRINLQYYRGSTFIDKVFNKICNTLIQ